MDGNTGGIMLGGKERHLRYDLNSVAEIGERLGITVRLDNLGQDLLAQELPLKALRVLLWAGLIHEDPELTEEAAGGFVDQDNFAAVTQYFFGLFAGIGAAIAPPAEAPEESVLTEEPTKKT